MQRGESDPVPDDEGDEAGGDEDGGSELYGTPADVAAVWAGPGGAGGSSVLNFYMPEGYRGVQQRIDEGVACGETLVKMLKERAKCEDAYANALRAWAKTWRDKLPESAAYGGFGTSLRALMEMADRQGEELSRAMVELAVSDESVLGRLQSGNKDIYHLGFTGGVKESAECKSEFQKAQKRFAHAFRKLERAIRAYWVAAKKADAATITHETLRNQHADNSKIRSAKAAIEAAEKEKAKRLETYRKEWAVVDELRPKYMQQMQEKYVPYEQMELKRLKHMKDTLEDLVDILKKNANDHMKAIEQFVETVANFQPQDDLDFWSANFGPGMPFDMSNFRDFPPDRMAVRSPGPPGSLPPTSASSEWAASTVVAPVGRPPSSSCTSGNQKEWNGSRVRTGTGNSSSSSANVYEKPAVAASGSPGALPRPGDSKSSQVSSSTTRNDMKQSYGPTRPPGSPSQTLLHSSFEMPSVPIPPPPPSPPPPPPSSLLSMQSSAGGSQPSVKALLVPRGILPPPPTTPTRADPLSVRPGAQSAQAQAASSGGGKGSSRSPRQSTHVLPAALKTPRRETKSAIRNVESSRLNLNETKYFIVNYPYVAAESDECSALPNDVLRLYARDEASNEWWVVVNLNAPGQPCGNIPKTYVEQLEEDEWQGLFDEQQVHRHEILREWVAKGNKPDF